MFRIGKLFTSLKSGCLSYFTTHTAVGKGIQQAKNSVIIQFKGLDSGRMDLAKAYVVSAINKAPQFTIHTLKDKEFLSVLDRFANKVKLGDINWSTMTKEELIETVLTKSGIGAGKFAQIISQDKSIMDKLSPGLQSVIKKSQSENPFSRTLEEAQNLVDNSLTSNKVLPASGMINTVPNAFGTVKSGIRLIKPLSAGTVGEAYLAKNADGKDVIVKMIKNNVDTELLSLEESIYKKIISEIAPDQLTASKHIRMLESLYKDWGKELDFKYEYNYNKLLQKGAKRYKVADITSISPNGKIIVMDKAEGIQMNTLMKMLKDYKKFPTEFQKKYSKEILENPWLANPDEVIKKLPDSITKAFDEMFMFMKNGKSSIMHGDPHMGNYFITASNDGNLIPVFIDTGNCVIRSGNQIKEDIAFLTNYFVGNAKGLAKYFLKQCEPDMNFLTVSSKNTKLISAGKDHEEALINKLAKEIQTNIFDKRQNVTDVDSVQQTIQTILERNGLTMKPEASTALKAQMQFYTGITEAASLSGKTINVGAIVKDVPNSLYYMIKSRMNPLPTVKDALHYSLNNVQDSTRIAYQFLIDNVQPITISYAKYPTSEIVRSHMYVRA